ncbi:hypothetical protein BDQ17DRAFT_1356550 [Cyathus striatus]|nr:hypothetical protein BDQ17DRAFT_1356550 [Cyathus striatus]
MSTDNFPVFSICYTCHCRFKSTFWRNCDTCRIKLGLESPNTLKRLEIANLERENKLPVLPVPPVLPVLPALPASSRPPPKKAPKVQKRKPQAVSNTAAKKQKQMDVLKSSAKAGSGVDLVSPILIKVVTNIVQQRVGNPNLIEYITASALYSALKNASSTRPFLFRGCHSIIHATTIDHTKRAEIVAGDLAKIPSLSSFNYDKPSREKGPEDSVRFRFRCTCQSMKTSGCLGIIEILVQRDSTHPVPGLVGQRIQVGVIHP